MESNLISLKEEAERRGVSPKALSERCRGGLEPLARKNSSGRWAFIEGGTDEGSESPEPDIPNDANKSELDRQHKYWQAKETRSKALIKQHEERRLIGGLVDRSTLENKWKTVLLSIRTQMLTTPDVIRRELGPEIIDDYAYRKIRDIVDTALKTAMHRK